MHHGHTYHAYCTRVTLRVLYAHSCVCMSYTYMHACHAALTITCHETFR